MCHDCAANTSRTCQQVEQQHACLKLCDHCWSKIMWYKIRYNDATYNNSYPAVSPSHNAFGTLFCRWPSQPGANTMWLLPRLLVCLALARRADGSLQPGLGRCSDL
jgi:hypothetical protein